MPDAITKRNKKVVDVRIEGRRYLVEAKGPFARLELTRVYGVGWPASRSPYPDPPPPPRSPSARPLTAAPVHWRDLHYGGDGPACKLPGSFSSELREVTCHVCRGMERFKEHLLTEEDVRELLTLTCPTNLAGEFYALGERLEEAWAKIEARRAS